MGRGEAKEKCGGGGAGATGWLEGRKSPGAQADPAAAGGECAKGGAGAVGEERKAVKMFLTMRERSRILV